MQADAGGNPITDRVLDKSTIIIWSYLACLAVLAAGLTLTGGLIVAAVVSLGIHFLLHVRLFEVTQTTTFVTSKPISSAVAEFSTARNPLTSIWIADANEGTVTGDEDDRWIEFTLGGPLNIGSQQVTVEVTETADSERQIELQRGENAILTATVTFESIQDGTRMIVTTERTSLHAFTLFSMTAIGSEVQSVLTEHGYETIDTERATGFRSLTGT